ncbi:MAG: metallophosphatase family protein [Syntrophorhabdaceae bacterium]|nr:metallophosphatase family protein [Syntrophorhabdaceae bacterium]
MRIAVLSDIHANWDALSAAVAEIRRRGIDRIFHLGDLTGYGAEPEICVCWAMEYAAGGVYGNHDEVACDLAEGENFQEAAREAALWSRDHLSGESKEYLAGLPSRFEVFGDALLVHGSLGNVSRYIYSIDQAAKEMESPLCAPGTPAFFGHTHIACGFVRREDGCVQTVPFRKFRVGRRERAFLNPGSVGQPRNRNRNASFLLYDTDLREVEWVWIPYDIESARRKIISAGLPTLFADRLLDGT